MPIRVLIAEDETVVRYALAHLLGDEADLQVIGAVGDGKAAVSMARQCQPDAILMDLDMPKLDGITAIRRIKEMLPQVAIVVLTVFGDDEHLFGAIKAGAAGYVLKEAPPERVMEAVRAAARGEGFLSSGLMARVLEEFNRLSRQRQAAREVFSELTRREMEVLELVAQGLRNREIAARLFLSEKTVKNHISAILMKLQVNDRTEAALLAERHGLTDHD